MASAPSTGSEGAAVQEWEVIVQHRWEVLMREVLAAGAERELSLREMSREFELLVAVVAWFKHGGNLTHAATSLKTNRKSVRERVTRWRDRYPRLVPPRLGVGGMALGSSEPLGPDIPPERAATPAPVGLGGTP